MIRRASALPSLHLVLDLETIPDPELGPYEAGEFPRPVCHQIVCAGYAWLENYRVVRWGVLGDDGEDEADILARLTTSIAKADPTVVTFHGRGFDLPVLAARCLRQGLPHPWYYATKAPRYRYDDSKHYDLCDVLADHGACKPAGLSLWSRAIGWPGKAGTDGSDVAGLIAKGLRAAVCDYCMTDVAQTAALLLRAELVRGRLSLAGYRAAAQALLKSAEGEFRTAGLAARVRRDVFLTTRPKAELEAAE